MLTNTKSSPDTNGLNNKAPSSPSVGQYQPTLMQQSAQQQLQSMQQIQQPSHQNSAAIPIIPVVNNREDPTVWETRKLVSGTPIGVGNNKAGKLKFR